MKVNTSRTHSDIRDNGYGNGWAIKKFDFAKSVGAYREAIGAWGVLAPEVLLNAIGHVGRVRGRVEDVQEATILQIFMRCRWIEIRFDRNLWGSEKGGRNRSFLERIVIVTLKGKRWRHWHGRPARWNPSWLDEKRSPLGVVSYCKMRSRKGNIGHRVEARSMAYWRRMRPRTNRLL